ncbi:hypothetical protein, partial [Methanosarcina sp.]|uniref:hypothetical protein n=1 Tax=Methanosarcina sp. TaxID=2213 RepID=UPI002ABAE63A
LYPTKLKTSGFYASSYKKGEEKNSINKNKYALEFSYLYLYMETRPLAIAIEIMDINTAVKRTMKRFSCSANWNIK